MGMKCQALKADGQPCQRRGVRGHELKVYCLQHLPGRDARKWWRGPLTKKATILKMVSELTWISYGDKEETMILSADIIKSYGFDKNHEGSGDVSYIQKVLTAEGYRVSIGTYAVYVWRKVEQTQ